jgi:hypothetical protein
LKHLFVNTWAYVTGEDDKHSEHWLSELLSTASSLVLEELSVLLKYVPAPQIPSSERQAALDKSVIVSLPTAPLRQIRSLRRFNVILRPTGLDAEASAHITKQIVVDHLSAISACGVSVRVYVCKKNDAEILWPLRDAIF